MKECIVCHKKKDFISRLFKFETCQKCREEERDRIFKRSMKRINSNTVKLDCPIRKGKCIGRTCPSFSVAGNWMQNGWCEVLNGHCIVDKD